MALSHKGVMIVLDGGLVLYVERKSQKGIVIGKGGKMIKAVGTDARKELERVLGIKIFLELHVKVHPRWRDDVRVLREMEPGAASLRASEPALPQRRHGVPRADRGAGGVSRRARR